MSEGFAIVREECSILDIFAVINNSFELVEDDEEETFLFIPFIYSNATDKFTCEIELSEYVGSQAAGEEGLMLRDSYLNQSKVSDLGVNDIEDLFLNTVEKLPAIFEREKVLGLDLVDEVRHQFSNYISMIQISPKDLVVGFDIAFRFDFTELKFWMAEQTPEGGYAVFMENTIYEPRYDMVADGTVQDHMEELTDD